MSVNFKPAPVSPDILGGGVEVCYYREAENILLPGRTIVVNAGDRLASMGIDGNPALLPFSSTFTLDGHLQFGRSILVLSVKGEGAPQIKVPAVGWDRFSLGDLDGAFQGNGSPELWRGPQTSLGVVDLADCNLFRVNAKVQKSASYELRINLWFAKANTDCAIHNEHDFVEFHTQIQGLGRMQKFRTNLKESLFEEQVMAPGYTTPSPFCDRDDTGKLRYPWHQYYADTDCLWLALEYHPL